MSSQTKIIKDILSSYDAILENKNFLIKELNLIQLKKTDYPNVKFDDDGTQYDSVNKSLLDDKKALLSTSHIEKYFVEIHYISEENKPKLEYIMTKDDINNLLCKYGYSI